MVSDVVLEFEYNGYNCLVRELNHGQYHCGYVYIPKGHPIYGMDYEDIYDKYPTVENVTHGGVTFSGDLFGEFAIGFDTMHVFDTPQTQTKEFVAENLKEIVDELIRIA